MDPSNRTKDALIARTEALCTSIADIRVTDPWGGEGYLSTILRTVQMTDSSAYSNVPRLEGVHDYATTAQREGRIQEQTSGLIKTTQDISTLIRDLQELWLFGGLDTLGEDKDGEEEREREKVRLVAEMVEALAGKKVEENKEGKGKEEGA